MIMGIAVRRQETGYAATGDKAGRRQKMRPTLAASGQECCRGSVAPPYAAKQ